MPTRVTDHPPRNASIPSGIAKRGRFRRGRLVACIVLAGAASGCAGLGEATTNSLFVAPGRFDVLTCRDLVNQERAASQRVQELEGLMRRAEAGSGGAIISTMAYRSDYLRARAELQLLRETAAKRECASEPIRGQSPISR